jgi:hypothetical protein
MSTYFGTEGVSTPSAATPRGFSSIIEVGTHIKVKGDFLFAKYILICHILKKIGPAG